MKLIKKENIQFFSEDGETYYGSKKMRQPKLGTIIDPFKYKKLKVVSVKKQGNLITVYVKEVKNQNYL